MLASVLVGIQAAAAQTEAPSADVDVDAEDEGTPEAKEAETRITDVRLGFDAQNVLLSFKLVNAFDESLQERIDSGLSTTLTFELELVRSRKRWFDKAVDSTRLQAVAKYNAVTREYQINHVQDGKIFASRVVESVPDLRAAMTEFEGFPAFMIGGKDPQQRLRGRIRAELRTRHLFFFIPDTVYTDWAETRKFRLAEEL